MHVLIVRGRITLRTGKAWVQTSRGVDAGSRVTRLASTTNMYSLLRLVHVFWHTSHKDTYLVRSLTTSKQSWTKLEDCVESRQAGIRQESSQKRVHEKTTCILRRHYSAGNVSTRQIERPVMLNLSVTRLARLV